MDTIRKALWSIQDAVNRLLPFTTPGTPLAQDIFHTLFLCSILYFAPSFFERQLAKQDGEAWEAQAEVDDGDQAYVHGNEVDGDAEMPVAGGEEDDMSANLDDDLEDDEEDEQDINPPHPPLNPAAPPAQPALERPLPSYRSRDIGKKKAASIARRDQKRAYHEFQRQQGEAQRARDREIEAALEAELYEEKRRRAVLEMELEEKRRAEREQRREKERRSREEEVKRRKGAVEDVRRGVEERGWVDLAVVARGMGGGADREWVERLVRAEGMVGREVKDGVVTMVTGAGFVVRLTEEDLREVYQRAAMDGDGDRHGHGHEQDGYVSWEKLSALLEVVVRRKGDVLNGKAERWEWERERRGVDENKADWVHSAATSAQT
ncbi:MAG: hypothetical protein M1827_006700 [Pycnora praestabilis]|nr:MAG: hypothetical protein M1827_006700 [Pycnora praestabilis]